MRSHSGVAAGALCIAAIACLSLAASASAAVSCAYSPSDRLLAVTATDSFTRIARAGDDIQVDDGHNPVACSGPPATVLHADTIQVTHTGRSADILSLSGGPFAPGFTSEPTGAPEIELSYTGPTFLDVRGGQAADRLTFSAGGINLNGDDDTDVTGAFTALLVEGRAGNDVIAPQPGYTRAAPRRILLGEGGKDTLIATPDGSFLHGGGGHDRLIGGPKADNLTGGRGSDLLRGGKGNDLIRAIDNQRDRVLCGPGFDRAKVDGIDIVRGCERLIAIKRRGPVK
jgi:hypothetical protein